MKLISPEQLAALLFSDPERKLHDRKHLLYQHVAAATNRDQLVALLRQNLANEPEMLLFLDQITGAAPANFERNFPADTADPLFKSVLPSTFADAPRMTIQSTPHQAQPDSRVRRRAKQQPPTK